jgi:hypothetical protein
MLIVALVGKDKNSALQSILCDVAIAMAFDEF